MVRIVSSAGTSFDSCTRDPSPTFLLAGCQSHRCEPLYYLSRARGIRTRHEAVLETARHNLRFTLCFISSEKPRKVTRIFPGDLWASHPGPRLSAGCLSEVSPKASPVHLSVPEYPTPGTQRNNAKSRGGSTSYVPWRYRRRGSSSLRDTIPTCHVGVKQFRKISRNFFPVRRKHRTRHAPTRP